MKRKFMQFFAPEGGEGGGSALDNLEVPEVKLEGEGELEQKEEQVIEEKTPPAAINYDEMAKAFATGLASSGFKPQEKEQPKLTPEEAKKLLNVWEPTKEWLERYDNLETRAEAIAEQRDGVVRNADTVAQMRMREMETRLEQTYGPLRQHIAEQQAKAVEDRFDGTYPELAKPEMKGLVYSVMNQLQAAQAFKAGDEAGNFKKVADTVATVIRTATNNPSFKLTPKGSTPEGKPKNNNALRPTSSGSGGGHGGKPAAAGDGKSKVVSLLEG